LRIIEQGILYKLETYTLNPHHGDGRYKAKWFKQALGFTSSNAVELALQIVFNQKETIPQKLNEYGRVYMQYISIRGANGRIIRGVRTYWIKEKDTGLIRFTNILPSKLRY
jgi:hypothetical protein